VQLNRFLGIAMLKWVLLALGLLLFTNGIFTRTFSFAEPERHCFYMDLVNINACFGSVAMPPLIVWSNLVIGGALVLGCLLYARAKKPQRRT
jgi:hypothetical protein